MMIKHLILFLVCLFMASACSTSRLLVDSPRIYSVENKAYISDHVSPPYQTVSPQILYVTDRKLDQDGKYVAERSVSMAFGEVTIEYGDLLGWNDLTRLSSQDPRERDVPLTITAIDEITRFPETPLPFYIDDGEMVTQREAELRYDSSVLSMQDHIRKIVERSVAKDIIFYIHGFNTSFEDAAFNLADIWHFTERHGVPIFYSWPAAHGGLLGYFADSESGEFSIFHLKETLRILAEISEVEKIHIIAHSRGTALISTAIRELVIESRACRVQDRDGLKLENVILAAPDLDMGVVQQRLAAERLSTSITTITVYMNEDDGALGLSEWLVDGLSFGRLTQNDLSPHEIEMIGQMENVNFIDVKGVSGFIGHSYYRTNSNMLSDLAILITQGFKPGAEGRPLIRRDSLFWELPENYP